MRRGFILSMTNPSAVQPSPNCKLQIRSVITPYFHDLYFRSKWTGSAFTLDCYKTAADAAADANKLAHGTHGAGNGVEVTMTADGGYSITATPMVVVLLAQGTWDDATAVFTGMSAGVIMDRLEQTLRRYMMPNEMLTDIGVVGFARGQKVPQQGPIMIGLAAGSADVNDGIGVTKFDKHVGIELYAWVDSADNPASHDKCCDLIETLCGIVLDEQRTLGGMVEKIEARGTWTLAVRDVDGTARGAKYEAMIPLLVTCYQFADSIAPAGSPGAGTGGGGHYNPLQP